MILIHTNEHKQSKKNQRHECCLAKRQDLTFINHSQYAQHFHLDNSARWRNNVTNLTHVQRVVIPLESCVLVHILRVLPGLWECSVIPGIPLVWKHVCYETHLALNHQTDIAYLKWI